MQRDRKLKRKSKPNQSQSTNCVKKFTIQNKLGIHARPAAIFVQAMQKYECEVFVQKGKQKVNGKSIMGLMMLAAGYGSNLTIETEGPDAPQAMNAIEQLFLQKFGEQEE